MINAEIYRTDNMRIERHSYIGATAWQEATAELMTTLPTLSGVTLTIDECLVIDILVSTGGYIYKIIYAGEGEGVYRLGSGTAPDLYAFLHSLQE